MWSDGVSSQYWTLQVDRTGEVSTSGNKAGNSQNGADRQGRRPLSKAFQPVQQPREQQGDPAALTRSIRDARTMQELAKVASSTIISHVMRQIVAPSVLLCPSVQRQGLPAMTGIQA